MLRPRRPQPQIKTFAGRPMMQHPVRNLTIACAALAGVAISALVVGAAEYKMTVNRDRLINAQNEPQNWLMMNGDYGSTRYSKLTQINRGTVKNMRIVWAPARVGLPEISPNRPALPPHT